MAKTVFNESLKIPEIHHANGWQSHLHDGNDENGHVAKIVLDKCENVTGYLPIDNVEGLVDILNTIDGEIGDIKPSCRINSQSSGRWIPCDGSHPLVPDPSIQGNEAYQSYVTLMGSTDIPNLTGCILVGAGTYTNPISGSVKTFTRNVKTGDVEHKMTLGEIKNHSHLGKSHAIQDGSGSWALVGSDQSILGPGILGVTSLTGDDTNPDPISLVQPSYGVKWFIKVKHITLN